MQTIKRTGRLGLVLHPRNEPTPVVEKLTSWARSHGKRVIVDACSIGPSCPRRCTTRFPAAVACR
jgi:hypothetical protein